MVDKPYSKVNTLALLSETNNIKNMIVGKMRQVTSKGNPVCYALLTYMESYVPHVGKSKRQQRDLVIKYISKTYPYWDGVVSDDPSKSLTALIASLKVDYLRHASTLDAVGEMVKNKLPQEDLFEICMHTQKLLSYCLYYIHIKRCPVWDKHDRQQTQVLRSGRS